MLEDRRIKTSLFAIAADLLLTALKASLAWITGSAALLADALHSGTDFFVSVVLLGSLVVRYRQEKRGSTSLAARRLESALAVLVALLILYVPFEILRNLDQHSPETLSHIWVGIGGTLVVIAVVYFMARLKTYVGQATDSPALEADGYHSKIDLFSSVAVLVSLLGMMVGVYLDEIAAVVIAVLIGIAGLELFMSGVRSLFRGEDLDTLALADFLPAWLAAPVMIQRISTGLKSINNFLFHWRWRAAAVALVCYLLSGLSQVPYGYEAVKLRFGEATARALSPGLYYTLPWPIENLQLVPASEVYSTTFGSRLLKSQQHPEQNPRLWRDIKGTRVHEDDTPYLATGDENLVDIVVTLDYRLRQPSRHIDELHSIAAIVNRYAEAALWQQTAQLSFDALFSDSHTRFADALADQARAMLAEAGIEIEIIDTQLQTIQPPALVVSAYRDRLNAEQEKVQRITRAQAQTAHNLLLAKAETITRQAQTTADLLERRLIAQGEAERFAQLAEVFRQYPESVSFHQFQQTLVEALGHKDILITDPAIDSRDLRVWGQSGLVTYPAGRLKP